MQKTLNLMILSVLIVGFMIRVKCLGSFRLLKPQNLVKIANPAADFHQYLHMSTKIFLSTDPSSESKATPPRKFKDFPFAYHQELTLKIDSLSNLGQGVARTTLNDGSIWVVFVPLVLAGEEVRVRVFRNMPSFSEADLLEVITPSPDRITPKCKYFAVCGGCQYQHMNIDMQRFWKKTQVDDVLARIGKLDKVAINDVVGTKELYGYRSKITPHYDAPVKSRPQDIKIGFQKRGTRNTIDIDHCVITTDAINAKYSETREKVIESVRVSPPKKGATLLFRECDDRRVETDNRAIANATVNGIKFQFRAGEFFQNNPFALPLMVDHVIEQAIKQHNGVSCSSLIDTYCGSGLFALCAASRFDNVYGVEISEIAVKAAIKSAVLNDIDNAHFTAGKSEAIFKQVEHLDRDRTVMVIDPPRRGCDGIFLKQLSTFKPHKLVYVSCDPATQARDARIIVDDGYAIVDVTPFDLFPQTRHIENVITFVRND